jgi:hypothetical protein
MHDNEDDDEVVYRDEATGVVVHCFTWPNSLKVDETRFRITRPPVPTNLPWDGNPNGMSLSAEELQALAQWFTKRTPCNARVWPYTENNTCVLIDHPGKPHRDARGRAFDTTGYIKDGED